MIVLTNISNVNETSGFYFIRYFYPFFWGAGGVGFKQPTITPGVLILLPYRWRGLSLQCLWGRNCQERIVTLAIERVLIFFSVFVFAERMKKLTMMDIDMILHFQ